MQRRSKDGSGKRNRERGKEAPEASQRRDDGRDYSRSRTDGKSGSSMPQRGDSPGAVHPVETKVQRRRDWRTERSKARPQDEGRGEGSFGAGKREAQGCPLRSDHREPAAEKKDELELVGSQKGRHISTLKRNELLVAIEEARRDGKTVTEIADSLKVTPRAIYRWQDGMKPRHGGGGGHNRITPEEKEKIVAFVRAHPDMRCRRIAYELERRKIACVGRTKVAEIMKEHGLNHTFERRHAKPVIPPASLMLHEPWKPNYVWGMDWTWLRVKNEFMLLLIVVDWYSRKIVSWGLFKTITSAEVIATVTDAVAAEDIDLLPPAALRPIVVADHGSANASARTKSNIEILGLTLWLSGIGRPTGNARTERTIGTLKAEEITLQDQYESETEARASIERAIKDYNFKRPNAGNGGFAPHEVHVHGRSKLTKERQEARKQTRAMRRSFWRSVAPELSGGH